jgi:hypothetical protein
MSVIARTLSKELVIRFFSKGAQRSPWACNSPILSQEATASGDLSGFPALKAAL